MLKEKNILLCISGGIAAYKIASLASMLKQSGAVVNTIMTEHATEFIAPLTFETLTGNRCVVGMFDRDYKYDVKHISLAKAADIIVIAPATANIIAKLAHGIADDMLTTTVLASTAPKLVVPTMNTNMYHNPATQDNIETLRRYGFNVISPATGHLACGDSGDGKMPEPAEIFEHILRYVALPRDMEGKKVLVTAGPTQEAIDPVRYITNHSTGKMGYAIAKACMLRGAAVTLVTGETSVEPPLYVDVIHIKSAADMYEAVIANAGKCDFIFKAAAVADYTPLTTADNKIKKKDEDMSIPLKRTQDILKALGENRKDRQVICGFSMETENMIENSRAKLAKKNIDMIVANNLKVEGAGFGTDTNVITIITKDSCDELEIMSKFDAANAIIDRAIKMGGKQN
ncbi:MAG: bifunctional phosphopantothenoylcysteine decarboxylase/phosphopantothenate--cysteine ligase CoaBC [Firmicutes bacterium]|nr:bifunctional phosphopantothenoylcysteine decarboxylase/phosphopantothenate--cysteine ligase CoaBC [Bacillota bacterium]